MAPRSPELPSRKRAGTASPDPLTIDPRETSRQLRRTRLEDANSAGTSLDLVRCSWYLGLMIRSVRIANRKHMSRLCWAVEGVVR